jgi:hypothetical protein
MKTFTGQKKLIAGSAIIVKKIYLAQARLSVATGEAAL